jgi:hypothetical protein
MDEGLRRKLTAVAGMVIQHIGGPSRIVDAHGISANETALKLLADFGFMEVVSDEPLMFQWTEAGRALLDETPGVRGVRRSS